MFRFLFSLFIHICSSGIKRLPSGNETNGSEWDADAKGVDTFNIKGHPDYQYQYDYDASNNGYWDGAS